MVQFNKDIKDFLTLDLQSYYTRKYLNLHCAMKFWHATFPDVVGQVSMGFARRKSHCLEELPVMKSMEWECNKPAYCCRFHPLLFREIAQRHSRWLHVTVRERRRWDMERICRLQC